jgi:hypothetical protein
MNNKTLYKWPFVGGHFIIHVTMCYKDKYYNICACNYVELNNGNYFKNYGISIFVTIIFLRKISSLRFYVKLCIVKWLNINMFKVVVDPCVAINKTLLDLELVLGTFLSWIRQILVIIYEYMSANVWMHI